MKKTFFSALTVISVLFFTSCNSTKADDSKKDTLETPDSSIASPTLSKDTPDTTVTPTAVYISDLTEQQLTNEDGDRGGQKYKLTKFTLQVEYSSLGFKRSATFDSEDYFDAKGKKESEDGAKVKALYGLLKNKNTDQYQVTFSPHGVLQRIELKQEFEAGKNGLPGRILSDARTVWTSVYGYDY